MKTFKIFCSILISSFWLLASGYAGYLQPVVAYITDSQGNPMVGTNVVITTWPPANAITGVATNLIANVNISENTGAGGLISNNLALGSYRLQISGYTRGVTFNVVSNPVAINVAQVGGEPVPAFANFTLAQFSDVGTMAGESTNAWTRNSYLGVSNAVSFNLATNGGPLLYSQLPWTPPTNTTAGIAYALGWTPPTNTTAGIDWALGYVPATNSYVGISNTLAFDLATNGGPIAYAQLPYTPPTNTYAGISNVLKFVIATNGAPIVNSQLTTNVLLACGLLPNASFTTNYGLIWLVYQTNGLMGQTLTNLPSGSICTTTNGQFFVLSNSTWLVK